MSELPGRPEITPETCRHCDATNNLRIIWRIDQHGQGYPAAYECIDGGCPGRIPDTVTDPDILAMVASHRTVTVHRRVSSESKHPS